MPLDRPIPAFYCCYLLRSTVRHNSLYVGSTPNPVRRLRQHNGDAKGGAVRTSRDSVRPWEMSAIVTGFPSHTAALQFEWAWQNPHLTNHIPPSSRITHTISKKTSGRPKRPQHSLTSLLSNLHLLLRVPSFSRWPLQLHFFAPDVHSTWLRTSSNAIEDLRDSLPVVTDFPQVGNIAEIPSVPDVEVPAEAPKHGIAALDVSYTSHKPHLAKAKNIVDFEREGSCKLCKKTLQHDRGIYAICSHVGCESVTHLICLSQHFLTSDSVTCSLGNGDGDMVVPIQGTCPSCGGRMRWIDVVKEVSLRMRGKKEIEKLLKEKRKKAVKPSPKKMKGKGKEAAAADEILDSDMDDIESEDDEMENFEEDELDVMEDDAKVAAMEEMDAWFMIDESDEESDLRSTAGPVYTNLAKSITGIGTTRVVVEDSD